MKGSEVRAPMGLDDVSSLAQSQLLPRPNQGHAGSEGEHIRIFGSYLHVP